MYLRRIKGKSGYEYVIRESCKEGDAWVYRDLMNLGEDPSRHINYPGGNGFYINPEVEDALQSKGVRYSSLELEEVFLPFLDPHIRRIIGMFRNERGPGKNRWEGCSSEELLRRQTSLHSFDKRRLHFLRFGRMDMGELDGRPWKFFNILLERSRDETEHIIEGMERKLRPHEIRSYLFTALHIQAYFANHPLRNYPSGLDPEKVDSLFLEELCNLNNDSSFFRGAGVGSKGTLHPDLQKYAILYFDHDFASSGPWDEYIRDFMRRRQFQHPPPSRPTMAVSEALLILEIQNGELSSMSRQDLVRRYRRRAKASHPDQGGDHEEFVRLAEAYQCLMTHLG